MPKTIVRKRPKKSANKPLRRLPDKPSALLALALSDLRKAEKSRSYVVDMNTWHQPNGRCSVCLAGAVMAFSLLADRDKNLDCWDYDDTNASKLSALDLFRRDMWDAGLTELGVGKKHIGVHVLLPSVPSYNKNKTSFHRTMRVAVSILKSSGL